MKHIRTPADSPRFGQTVTPVDDPRLKVSSEPTEEPTIGCLSPGTIIPVDDPRSFDLGRWMRGQGQMQGQQLAEWKCQQYLTQQQCAGGLGGEFMGLRYGNSPAAMQVRAMFGSH